jgi:hypothetical protein
VSPANYTEQYEVGNKFPRSAITVVTGELGIAVPNAQAKAQQVQAVAGGRDYA